MKTHLAIVIGGPMSDFACSLAFELIEIRKDGKILIKTMLGQMI